MQPTQQGVLNFAYGVTRGSFEAMASLLAYNNRGLHHSAQRRTAVFTLKFNPTPSKWNRLSCNMQRDLEWCIPNSKVVVSAN